MTRRDNYYRVGISGPERYQVVKQLSKLSATTRQRVYGVEGMLAFLVREALKTRADADRKERQAQKILRDAILRPKRDPANA